MKLPRLALAVFCSLAQPAAQSEATPAEAALSSADRPTAEDEWYLKTEDGHARLYVWEVGRGQPVLVVHGGFGAEHSYLFDAVRGLTDRFRFVFYDQRGSLRSPCEPEHISFEKHVADLEQVRAESGLEKPALLAHSMGCVIAMQYLQDHPGRAGDVVLVAAPAADNTFKNPRSGEIKPFFEREAVERELQKVRDSGVTGAKLESRLWRVRFAGSNVYHVERWRQMKGGQAFYSQTAGTAAGRTLPAKWNYEQALADHDGRVTVINGDHDFVDFGGSFWSGLAERQPGLRLVLIEKAGHNCWIDAPDRFGSELVAGLRASAERR